MKDRITTSEIKSLEIWPKVKEALDETIKEYKKNYPNDRVILSKQKYCWQIVLNGTPVIEIDAIDLKNQIKH